MSRAVRSSLVLIVLAAKVTFEGDFAHGAEWSTSRPNIVLVMADDQGWGDVSYNGHPTLRTPVLDEIARSGLRFDRFYSAAAVCSPTRGSVMTGRHPVRFGCFSWGHTLRPQETTIAEALQRAGYATGHFGKWHLGPVRADSPVSPGHSGFDEWFSSPNFFENSPLLSHRGQVIETQGESSRVIVDRAVEWIRSTRAGGQPFLAVVWFGNPHLPHEGVDEFRTPYRSEPANLREYYAEISAMDAAVGHLRTSLRDLIVADHTLLWYCSDNGGMMPLSTGGLRGKKAELYEGGIRVPGLVEWPERIRGPRVIDLPCVTSDIFPTVLELAGVAIPPGRPLDGVSLAPLLDGAMPTRPAIGFWEYPVKGIGVNSGKILAELRAAQLAGETPPPLLDAAQATYRIDIFPGRAAWMDGRYKLHRSADPQGLAPRYELYDVVADRAEARDLATTEAPRVGEMLRSLEAWQRSVLHSLNGGDDR